MTTIPASNTQRQSAPLVSVLMPAYNGEKYLAEAIDSILTQTFADFEFIIVDDGSTDGSAQIIRDYAQRDERIRFFQHAVNRGQSSALNTGLAEARGEYIAGMDADDISLPERLRKQVDFLNKNPAIGVVATWRRLIDQDAQPLDIVEAPANHVHIVFNLVIGAVNIGGALAMMRRSLLESVGGYDESVLVRDWELWTRLASRTRFANLPETLYLNRKHDANLTLVRYQELADDWRAIHKRWLERLLGEAPGAALQRIHKVRSGMKLPWAERRRLRRELNRLIDALIASNTVDDCDRSLLEAEFARMLESTTPRLWQMFLHWRRYRLGF